MAWEMRVPRVGEKVWQQCRHKEGKQPNGFIKAVTYDERTVAVKFHDDNELVEFSWFELDEAYVTAFGGSYMLWEGL